MKKYKVVKMSIFKFDEKIKEKVDKMNLGELWDFYDKVVIDIDRDLFSKDYDEKIKLRLYVRRIIEIYVM